MAFYRIDLTQPEGNTRTLKDEMHVTSTGTFRAALKYSDSVFILEYNDTLQYKLRKPSIRRTTAPSHQEPLITLKPPCTLSSPFVNSLLGSCSSIQQTLKQLNRWKSRKMRRRWVFLRRTGSRMHWGLRGTSFISLV